MMDMVDREYSDFYLNGKKFPVIKTWEVGKTYKVEISLKMLNKDESINGVNAGFKLVSIKEEEKEPSKMNLKDHKDYMNSEMKNITIK